MLPLAMRHRRQLSAVVLMMVVGVLLPPVRAPATASEGPFCSISVSPFGRPPGTSFFLGRFTEQLVPATPGPVEVSSLPGHMGPLPVNDTLWGQHLTVSRAGGWASDVIYDPGDPSPQEVVLVMWDYDAGCNTARYGGDLPVGIPGEEVFVVARLRDSTEWVDGIPTLDTFWAGDLVLPKHALTEWREFYEWVRSEYPSPPWEAATPIAAEEAFAFMAALPQPCDALWNPLRFATRMAVLNLAYQQDDRFLVKGALERLARQPVNLDHRRRLCLADPRKMSLP